MLDLNCDLEMSDFTNLCNSLSVEWFLVLRNPLVDTSKHFTLHFSWVMSAAKWEYIAPHNMNTNREREIIVKNKYLNHICNFIHQRNYCNQKVKVARATWEVQETPLLVICQKTFTQKSTSFWLLWNKQPEKELVQIHAHNYLEVLRITSWNIFFGGA